MLQEGSHTFSRCAPIQVRRKHSSYRMYRHWEVSKGSCFSRESAWRDPCLWWGPVLPALLHCPRWTRTRASLCPAGALILLLLPATTLAAFICLCGSAGQLPGWAAQSPASSGFTVNRRSPVCHSCKLVYLPDQIAAVLVWWCDVIYFLFFFPAYPSFKYFILRIYRLHAARMWPYRSLCYILLFRFAPVNIWHVIQLKTFSFWKSFMFSR